MMLRAEHLFLVTLAWASIAELPQTSAEGLCLTSDSTAACDDVSLLQRRQQVGVAALAGEKREASECGIVEYAPELALPSNAEKAGIEPPMALGTWENMGSWLQEMGLDFTGIWWMRDNPMQELVSFAGAWANSSTFPARMMTPDGKPKSWSWVDDGFGKALAAFSTMSPENSAFSTHFYNSTTGYVSTFGLEDIPLVWVKEYKISKVSDDEWLRPTTFQKGSIVEDTSYTLIRIVYDTGEPHPTFWPLFLKHMEEDSPGKKLLSFGAGNTCRRRCGLAFSCKYCSWICRSS